jgi:hypothetical protein
MMMPDLVAILVAVLYAVYLYAIRYDGVDCDGVL